MTKRRKTYLLVLNPISGDLDKSEIEVKTLAFADEANVDVIVYETTGKRDDKALEKLYELHKPERILIAGGDGTIKLVGEALEKKDVIFGILPAGSANGLSVDLGLPNTIEENLSIAFHNHYIEMDIICMNGRRGIHLSDMGLNAQMIKNYENSSLRGKFGYALQAINTLTEMEEPFEAKIEANGGTIECVARMIVIANSQKYGTGVTINPDGKMDDGKFELIILKNLDLIVFGKIITGNMPVNSEDVEIISTETARITTLVPVGFQIDGEYIGEENKIDIMVLPSKMKVAIP